MSGESVNWLLVLKISQNKVYINYQNDYKDGIILMTKISFKQTKKNTMGLILFPTLYSNFIFKPPRVLYFLPS